MKKRLFDDSIDVAEELFELTLNDEDVAFIGDYYDTLDALKSIYIVDGEDMLFTKFINLAAPELCEGEGSGYYMIGIIDGEIYVDDIEFNKDGKLLNVLEDYEEIYIRCDVFDGVKDIPDVNVTTVYYPDEQDEMYEEESDGALTILFDEAQRPRGFHFETNKDDKCFNMEYCSCNALDENELAHVINKMINSYFDKRED